MSWVWAQSTGVNSSTYAAAGTNNRLVDDGTFTYEYDAEGNRSVRIRKSSAAALDYRTEYTWDHRNRLTLVTFKNNVGTVTKTVVHTYDADNRWIGRLVDSDGAQTAAGLERTVFVRERSQVATLEC